MCVGHGSHARRAGAGGGIGRAVRLACDVGPRTGARSARRPAPVTSCHGQVPSRGWRSSGRPPWARVPRTGGSRCDATAPVIARPGRGAPPGQRGRARRHQGTVGPRRARRSSSARCARSRAPGTRRIGVPDDHGSFAEFVVDGISERQRKAIGPLPRQHGMLAVMLREGQPLRLADIRADPRFEGWPAAHPELADILGMPIKDGDRGARLRLRGQQDGCRRRVHRARRRVACAVRRACRDRAHQRPPLRARPPAFRARGARPAGQGPARRGLAEAVQHPGQGARGVGAREPGSGERGHRPGGGRDGERGRPGR